jgi:hypothetical protein
MMRRFWLKGMLISMMAGSLAAIVGWGEGCLNTAVQRLLISYAFD